MNPSPTPDLTPGERAGQSPEAQRFGIHAGGLRRRLFIVIFESDTRAGRPFDIVLLWAIVISVLVVMLDASPAFRRATAHFSMCSNGVSRCSSRSKVA